MIKKENIIKNIKRSIKDAVDKGLVEKECFYCTIESYSCHDSFKKEIEPKKMFDWELYDIFSRAFKNDQDVYLCVNGWYGYADEAEPYPLHKDISTTFVDQSEYNDIRVEQISKITDKGVDISFEIDGATMKSTKKSKLETLLADIVEYSGVEYYSEELKEAEGYKTLAYLCNFY